MVKFGRHLDYYTHNELRDTAFYVVPYNDIKGKCMPGHIIDAGPKSPDRGERKKLSTERFDSSGRGGGDDDAGGDATDAAGFRIDAATDADAAHLSSSAPASTAAAARQVMPPTATGPLSRQNSSSGGNSSRRGSDALEESRSAGVPRNAATFVARDRLDKLESDFYFAMQRFKTEWRTCLALAADDFERSTREFWRGVFEGVTDAAERQQRRRRQDEGAPKGIGGIVGVGGAPQMPTIEIDTIRGCLPDTALRLYLAVSAPPQIQEVYEHLKDMHSTALVNSEALRKLVKKFDKDVDKLCARTNAELSGNWNTNGNGGGFKECKTCNSNDSSDAMGGMSCKQFRLSGHLLPEVYSSNFNVGLPTVEATLALVRSHLGLDEDDDEDDLDLDDVSSIQAARIRFMSMDQEGFSRARSLAGMGGGGGDPHHSSDDDDAAITPENDVAGFFGLTLKRRGDTDAILVEKRKLELRWLRKLVASLEEHDRVNLENAGGGGGGVGGLIANDGASSLIGCLVGHRGFHSIKDRSDKRPLENSQMSYEAAWTNGIHLCECDITLTRDDRIILCHDENFTRLALDPDDPQVKKQVRELTYKEIINLPLKSGSRPPLLFDVLRSAHAIGGEARMIVEIKPGNTEAGTALARMFAKHPQLMERCAVVMSFDAFAMQNLRRELEVVFPTTPRLGTSPMTSSPSAAMMMAMGLGHQVDLRKSADAIAIAGSTAVVLPPAHPLAHPLAAHPHPVYRPSMHRLGISVKGTSGLIPNIPTAMSIGDIHGVAVPQPVEPGAPFGAHARNDSVDQLGMSLESMGAHNRKDSFHFSPFKQAPMGRNRSGGALSSSIHSNARQGSGGALALPSSPGAGNVRFEERSPRLNAMSFVGGEQQQAHTVAIPKLLLITRCGPAQNVEQRDALKVDVSVPADLARAKSWLQGGSPQERLDGLYLQFQPCMLEPVGIDACRSLTEHYSVGVWGANPKPDDFDTFSRLVKECGVAYVNSGLQKRFLRNARRNSGGVGAMAATNEGGDAAAKANMEENSKTWAHPGRQQKQPVHLGLPW